MFHVSLTWKGSPSRNGISEIFRNPRRIISLPSDIYLRFHVESISGQRARVLRTTVRMSFINLTAPGAWSSCIVSTCAPARSRARFIVHVCVRALS